MMLLKDFIRCYEYGKTKKLSKKKWTLYIAKTGHKWYTIESISEHLFTRIGQSFGLNMAKSKLCFGCGQLRFLSQYFLKKDRQLIHGAEIYPGFLSDEEFVQQIEAEDKARDFFTIRFTKRAIKYFFPDFVDDIFNDFLKMVVFNAIIGNNDRHFYNWGIVRNIKGQSNPYFSPVYDTARGLYWNISEDKLPSRVNLKSQEKYVAGSKPKLGWENESDINHFKLFDLIYTFRNEYGVDSSVFDILDEKKLWNSIDVLNTEFKTLLSEQRRELVKNCLIARFHKLKI